MIGGVTHRMLPHLSGVPHLHLHVNRPLNSLVNYCISRAHDHNIADQEAQQIVNIAEVEDPQGGGKVSKVFGVFSSSGLYPILQRPVYMEVRDPR